MAIRFYRTICIGFGLLLTASCTTTVSIQCNCATGISNVRVGNQSLGSMSSGQTKDVTLSGGMLGSQSASITWTYQGNAYSGSIPTGMDGTGGDPYYVDCTWSHTFAQGGAQ